MSWINKSKYTLALAIGLFAFSGNVHAQLNTGSLDVGAFSDHFYADHFSTDSELNPQGQYTVSVWFKKPSTGLSTWWAFSNITDTNATGPLFGINGGPGSSLQGTTWDSSSGTLNVSAGSTFYTNNEWYHVAMVKVADNDWRVYLASTSTGHTLIASSTATRIASTTNRMGIRVGANFAGAADSTPTQWSAGLFDELQIWDTALDASQLDAVYLQELTGDETGLVGYWNFNNTLADQTTNGNDLTGTGTSFSTDTPFVGTASNDMSLTTVTIQYTLEQSSWFNEVYGALQFSFAFMIALLVGIFVLMLLKRD